MKTLNFKLSISILLMFSFYSSECQVYNMFRGHSTDDLYVKCSPLNADPMVLYFSQDGEHVHMQNNVDIIFGADFTSEAEPGLIISHSDQYFAKSIDSAKTFNLLALFANDYSTISNMYGGEIPGEFIIMGYDQSLWPYEPAGVVYKTTDYFAHYTLIADSVYDIIHGEIGKVSGEVFQLPINNGYGMLMHSNDFGANFDTIMIDSSIINENGGLFFNSLSRGSSPGELFLVTRQTVSATEVHYSIYHSTDYGNSWQLKSTQLFENEYQMFTAGRGACKYYIASTHQNAGDPYNTLSIMYSNDCGETFTTYEYMLTPEVGLKKNAEAGLNKVTISPNPASHKMTLSCQIAKSTEIEIVIHNSTGQCVLQIAPSWEAGNIEKKINIEGLKQGLYYVQIQSAGSTIATGKFIISQ